MITHVVTFRFADASPSHLARCRAMIEGLVGTVGSLRSMTVGLNIVESPRAHHLALIATFDDLAALSAYQDHPEHLPVADYLRSAAVAITAVDFES